ncbi:hypothetical protein SAMN04489760_11825 [Syntrophus gentianae]|uniref:Uncharacterized protein n=1 Tax=Syntrophus gentianae TaxID=43775 RepID=A0A1H7YWK1_9BACT|nr:hypothetical protein SAMN04489760_11825 [Syntrophus gentianae]
MTKIDKVLKKLSDLYEFNRKIKTYALKEKAKKPIQPTRNTRG